MSTLQLILLGLILFAGAIVGAFAALYRLGTRRIKYAERYYETQRRLDDELDEVPGPVDEIPRHEFEIAFNENYDPDKHLPEYLEHVEEVDRAKAEVETNFSIEPE